MQQLPFPVQLLHLAPLVGPIGSTLPVGPARALMNREGNKEMLWTICVILLVLWALGMATAYTAGGLIHVLLVIAVVVMVFRLLQGRSVI
jgi:Family of unknown function (DUF5670)